MLALPTIGFDTSAINALEKDGMKSAPLMVALRIGFNVRLPAMSADEVLSDPEPARREAWLSRCQRLLASGESIWPPHEILRLLISEHFRKSSAFDWKRVNVRARIYELSLIGRDFSDELCVKQREEQLGLEKSFRKAWKGLRPKLDELLAKEPLKRPTSYVEAVAIAKISGGVLWGFGQALYKHVTGAALSEAEIETFMEICPPFRAASYGLVMAWFNGALKHRRAGEPRPPGRNDLLMAVYLPYCRRFVTDDWPQENSLREIVAEANIPSDVLSYQAFSASFGALALVESAALR